MKVVNIGNIAEAYICDDLPAMGVVIEATLDELERLPNLTYKEVTISATPRRNCERFASAEEADAAYRRFCEREVAKIPLDAVDYSKERAKIPTKDKWLFAPATEQKGQENG